MTATTAARPLLSGALGRFWAKVDRTGECWLWTAYVHPSGYGQFGLRAGTKVFAHRLAYESLVGPIPPGLDLDHLCRVRHCVRPSHLEPVTRQVNLLRGDTIPARKAAQTHCVHGHEFTPENTQRDKRRGTRRCAACNRARVAASRAVSR